MRVTTITCDDCLKTKLEKDIICCNNRDYCRKCVIDRLIHSFFISPKKNCSKCNGTGKTIWWDYGEPRSDGCDKCKGCGYKLGD